jgi:hypothetical protein
MIPMEPVLFFPVILNGYPASIARNHSKAKKKKKPCSNFDAMCKALREGL